MGTADLFLIITDDDHPILRVDVYGGVEMSDIFREALAWDGLVFLGYGEAIYVIDPNAGSAATIDLDSYFGKFYATKDYLLATSGTRLLRLSPCGLPLWESPTLGLDGVIVETVDDTLIRGTGSGIPGGWRPFALRLDSGQLITDDFVSPVTE